MTKKRKRYNTAILPGSLPDRVRQYEAILVAEAISIANGNFSMAARILGINRTTLIYKRKVLGLPGWSEPETTALQAVVPKE